MVVTGKVFRLVEALPLPEIASRLKGYRVEKTAQEGEQSFTLITEVTELSVGEGIVSGVYAEDYLMHVFHRGRSYAVPRTLSAYFGFMEHDGRIFLAVLEKKLRANRIAKRLGLVLFGRKGMIAEARIPPERLAEFHTRNPKESKVIYFDNLDAPNITKVAIYGPDLVETELFKHYMSRGDLWYVVAKAEKYDYVVGVTRDACVVIFNTRDKNSYLEYVRREILPMAL